MPDPLPGIGASVAAIARAILNTDRLEADHRDYRARLNAANSKDRQQ